MDVLSFDFGQVIEKSTLSFLHDDPVSFIRANEFDEVADGVAVEQVEEVALKDDLVLFLGDNEFSGRLFAS